ncbi:glycerophosphodiester phosphodiesterase family protein [Catalinimonas niigatensis]|uniref:glycerophosphodiester phosphodiesterase family protein n=1 Tax=Catalinimonas niigatensis TaxID=1397264 RepID=UPI002666E363|nr:glycerophosphodiester phosphodiesterase family protein [Catalinimonas niigatensis]WPP48486.1 glycerophosphodiester phosphodiesterase family protein [Catalinimonas niigatensis]
MRNLFLLLLVIGAYACSPSEVTYEEYVPDYSIQKQALASLLEEHPIEVVVHRGANHLAPENTFAAAVKAIELGVDYVEIDVHRSLDGVHYIMHDLGLGRTTDGWGPILLRKSAYIDQLDAGSWFGEAYAGEKVPRLEEYLRWIKGKAKVYLDVKTADLEEVVRLIHELEMEQDTFFWFWSDNMLEEFRAMAPELRIKINAHSVEEIIEAKEEYGANIIECDVAEISPEMVHICDSLGIQIMAYATTNTKEEFRAVIQSHADLVNLDKPSLYLEVLQNVRDSLKVLQQ